MQQKELKPSTRCIHNLSDCGFTKTGLSPDKFKEYEREQQKRIKRITDNVSILSKAEIDLLTQMFLT